MSGTKAVVGAPGPNGTGAVYVFDADTTGYPTDIALSRSAVPVNRPAGTVVGSFSSRDPDSGDTFTYALASGLGDGDNASFTITGDQLRTSVVFDHETSCSVRVRTTDAAGRWYEEAFPVAVLAPPTADVVDVSPDPRPTSVSSIAIVFSHAVTGFDLANLTLTRDGGANLLTSGQTLSTSDNIHWTLGNLRGITDALGTYDLTLTAVGSGITDAAGSALTADAADQWVRRAGVIGDPLYTIDDPTDPWITTPPQDDHFGYSVAVSGNSLVAGAPGYDYEPPPPPSPSAYDYPEYNVGQVSTFDAYTGEGPGRGYFPWGGPLADCSGAALGSSVGISGDAVVAAGSSFIAIVPNAPDGWPGQPNSTGLSVAMLGSTVVVGAPGDDTGATDAGAAYLYDAGTQDLLRTLANATPAANDNFGALGGFLGKHRGRRGAGRRHGCNGCRFGLHLRRCHRRFALDAQQPHAGSRGQLRLLRGRLGQHGGRGGAYDDTGATDAGAVYVFDAATGNLLSTLLNPTPAASDNFGFSVAASESTVLVGAPMTTPARPTRVRPTSSTPPRASCSRRSSTPRRQAATASAGPWPCRRPGRWLALHTWMEPAGIGRGLRIRWDAAAGPRPARRK